MAHGGKRLGAGRKPGSVSKDKSTIEFYARSVVEDEKVQQLLRQQAQKGTLPVPLYQLFFHYAYGRPREQQADDQAFIADLMGLVLKYASSHDAKREVQALIETHTASAHSLRVVA